MKKIILIVLMLMACQSFAGLLDRPFIQSGESNIFTAVFSSDEKYILSTGRDSMPTIWNVETGREVRKLYSGKELMTIGEFSNKMNYAAVSGWGSKILLMNPETGKIIKSFPGHAEWTSSIHFDRYDERLISAGGDGEIKVWDIGTGRMLKDVKVCEKSVDGLVLVPNSNSNVVISCDGSDIAMWDIDAGKLVRTYKKTQGADKEKDNPTAIAVDPSGFYVAASYNKDVTIWNLNTGAETATLGAYSSDINGIEIGTYFQKMSFSPASTMLAAGTMNGTVYVFDISTGAILNELKGHTGSSYSVQFSKDGKNILSGSQDGTIRLWNLATSSEVKRFSGEAEQLSSMALSPDGKFLACGSSSGLVLVINATDGTLVQSMRGHDKTVDDVNFSKDSRYIFSASFDNTVRRWDIGTGEQKNVYMGAEKDWFFINASLPSPDGKTLFTAGDDGIVRQWNIETGKEIKQYDSKAEEGKSVRHITFINGGKQFIASQIYGPSVLWDTLSGNMVKKLDNGDYNEFIILDDKFSGLLSTQEGELKLVDVMTGKASKTIKLSDNYLSAIAVSPDKKYAVAADSYSLIHVVDLKTFKEIKSFHVNAEEFSTLIFSNDGRKLYGASWGGFLRVIDVSTGSELASVGVFKDGEWVAITPSGYYTASAGGIDHLNTLTAPMRAESITLHPQIITAYNRPDMVAQAMAGSTVKTVAQNTIDTTAPALTITEPAQSRAIKRADEATVHISGTAKDDTDIADVRINGISAPLDASGGFSADVLVKVGDNTITVTAFDTSGNKSSKDISVHRDAAAGVKTAKDTTVSHGRFVALIIGVGSYTDANISSLDNPVKDAESLETVLKDRYGFETKLMKDPTRSEIIDALEQLSSELNSNDSLLIFYAGHGYWDDGKKIGYWLPSDARKTSKAEWLSNSVIKDYIAGINTRHTLLVADACFGGAIFKTRKAFTPDKASAELFRLPSRKAMTSGTLTEVPDESVFVKYLLKRLNDNTKDMISAGELFSEFREAVINNSPTGSVPQYGEVNGTGDEGGDFIFMEQ